jgi:hypothetical protein
MLDGCLLERTQLLVATESGRRDDLRTAAGRHQRQTCGDALAVLQRRAGTALAVIAALLRARDSELLAQRVEQSNPRIGVERVLTPVNDEVDLKCTLGSSLASTRFLPPAAAAKSRPAALPPFPMLGDLSSAYRIGAGVQLKT